MFAELIRAVLQSLIEAEAADQIGAHRYQRSPQRTTVRNGHRPKTVSITAGDIEYRVPSCGLGRSSRRCWSHAGASIRRCTR